MFKIASLSVALVVSATVAEAGLKVKQWPAVTLRPAAAEVRIDPIDREIQRRDRNNRAAIEAIKRRRMSEGQAGR